MPLATTTLPRNEEINGDVPGKTPSKLIVCFDGTGNRFSGDTSDTNIVKLYEKFDRDTDPHQFHYYQPGIGTYSANATSLNLGLLGSLFRRISQTVDEGVGTSFDQHVIAGYRFIMRYYDDDDKIFMFGFSRGAFTARFLARMISTVGLLSKGNEEMVPFAYKSYQDYETGTGNKTAKEHWIFMQNFKKTFCRAKAKVHFLGLFDTVRSVSTFDVPFATKTYLAPVLRTADHVRHAVSIDERRLKFKPALLAQDEKRADYMKEDIKEVWFPGNHGDVGGGWRASGDKHGVNDANDPVQLSDISLAWMIRELQDLEPGNPSHSISWNDNVKVFLKNFDSKEQQAYTAPMHNVLKLGGGSSLVKVIFWNIMEYIPIFKRLELMANDKWKSVYFPPNMGDTRDLPSSAVLHPSVMKRIEAAKKEATENKATKLVYDPVNQGMAKARQEQKERWREINE
ncbi:MAG: hypothetical protein M1835_001178 [Candelina submexicana]|nr:MAG: hypothetical protein M1835_001178 [Candelina submexicana]